MFATSFDVNCDYTHSDGKSGRGHGGVAIIAKKGLNMVSLEISDQPRIVAVLVRGLSPEILLVAVYMPTGTDRDKVIEFQETLDKVCSIVAEHGNGRMVVIGGDWNVDLTRDVHRNRKYVVELMTEMNLTVPAEAALYNKYSLYRQETRGVSLLDYFLVDTSHRHIVKNYIIYDRSALNKSDHEPVLIEVSVNISKSQPTLNKKDKIDWPKARKDGAVAEYQSRVSSSTYNANNVEDIVNGITQAANVLPRRGVRNRASRWWSPQLTTLRKNCLAARRAWQDARVEEREEAQSVYRREKREYLNEQRKQRLKKQKEEDEKKEQECGKVSLRYFKFMRKCQPRRSIGRITVEEKELFQPQEIANAFLNHFVKTGKPVQSPNFNSDWQAIVQGVVETACGDYEANFEKLDPVNPVTEVEINDVIGGMVGNKAPGYDGIMTEHLKEADGAASKEIAKCMQNILKTAVIPENFKYGLVSPVYKGHGSNTAATDSYRDISVLTLLCKIFEKLIVRRLADTFTDAEIPGELQFAYHKNRGTLQANFILAEIVSANQDLGKPVYLAYLDVQKCFNSIWHAGLLYKLLCVNTPPRLLLVLRNLYREFNIKVKVNQEVSTDGKIQQGLKQGGILSTSMLMVFMNDKIEMLRKSGKGAKIGDRTVPVIAYADDEVLISTDPDELQDMLAIAYEHSCLWRYKYSASKSKVMVYGKKASSRIWRLGKEEIRTTDEYAHLGVTMAPRSVARRRIEQGFNKARRAFYAHCIHGTNLRRVSPLSLYATWRIYAEPILTYSLAVTTLNASDTVYLETMLLRLYRMMQGLPAKTQKIVVYAMLGALSCRGLILKITLQFIGFLLRAAREHELTQYTIMHGSVNEDRKSSIVHRWDHLLALHGLPSMAVMVANNKAAELTSKKIKEMVNMSMHQEVVRSAEKLTSVFWLPNVMAQEMIYLPPSDFWPMSRYSVGGRLATVSKINLLSGHSKISTGMVRRHVEQNSKCPLCRQAIETLEHFMYECVSLESARRQAQSKYDVTMRNEIPAVESIIQADKRETLFIHYLYKTRVRIEVEGPNPAIPT